MGFLSGVTKAFSNITSTVGKVGNLVGKAVDLLKKPMDSIVKPLMDVAKNAVSNWIGKIPLVGGMLKPFADKFLSKAEDFVTQGGIGGFSALLDKIAKKASDIDGALHQVDNACGGILNLPKEGQENLSILSAWKQAQTLLA